MPSWGIVMSRDRPLYQQAIVAALARRHQGSQMRLIRDSLEILPTLVRAFFAHPIKLYTSHTYLCI
eukprot:6742110-Pyramimonas_sp.AAC.2